MNSSFDYVSAGEKSTNSLPAIILLGTIGNILSFIVFSRKKFKNTIFETYFRLLTITDTVTMLYPTGVFLKQKFPAFIGPDLDIFGCIVFNYFTYTFPAISAWLLTLITFDRMVSIVFPTYLKSFRKNIKYHYFFCCLATLSSMAAYSPVLIYFQFNTYTNFDNQTNQTITYNQCNYQPEADVLPWIDLFFANVVPALIMLILNIATIGTLFKSRCRSSIGLTKRDIRFAFTCFALNFFFFFLLIISEIYYLSFPFATTVYIDESEFWRKVTTSIYSVNFSIIFYVNLIINSMFQEEILNMFNEIKSFFCNKT